MKPYEPPKTPTFPKSLTQQQIRVKEAEFAAEIAAQQKRHDRARVLIAKIEEREACRSTDDEQQAEQEIQDDMEKKVNDRQKVRNKRLENYEKAAENETQFQNTLTTALNNVNNIVTTVAENNAKVLTLLECYIEFKINPPRDNNDNDSSPAAKRHKQ